MKSARVYSVTKWYAKCPSCRGERHVRDDAPPYHAEQVYCGRCDELFLADLEDRIVERQRQECLADQPAHRCTCRGKDFGRHDLHCDVKQKERGR